jgi:hypothetical protein
LDLLNLFYQQADAAQKTVIDDLFKRVVFHDFTIQNAKSVQLANGEYETTIDLSTFKSVVNQANNLEEKERIDEEIEVALFTKFPAEKPSDRIFLARHQFTQDRSMLKLSSREQPQYVQIDPRRLRIDRTPGDNLFKIEK